ncbi:MAG TPA: hypothetical protein VG078_06580 [Acidimicrobiales bacterium]|nr:hypothetical protein [Acidimicrobiales bacterium]
MTSPILAASGGWTWRSWLWLVVPLAIYSVISLGLFAAGRHREPDSFADFFFGQISDSLQRATGFAGWAMAGVLSGLLMLGIAVMGFYWDVAWHYDFGRDRELFTPSHVMILVGLGGLFYSAIVTVIFASVDRAPTRFGVGFLRIPLPAVLLAALGFGGAAAFPLDALWHDAYGVDVTLWSPTHLQLMAGGALATIALWLIVAEVLPSSNPNMLGRGIHALAAGATLTGLTIFQGEFEFGGPQFQAVYLPILIAAAGAFTLVVARLALGRWGAVKAVVAYLVLRVLLGLMVGGALGHTYPRFALYLPIALVVEGAAVWIGTRDRLRFGLVAGALAGSVGLAGEMAWVILSGWGVPVSSLALKAALLSLPAGVAGGVLGAGVGRAFIGAGGGVDAPRGHERSVGVPVGALALAGVVLLGVLAYPLPRRVGDVSGVVALERQGDRAFVEVTLVPPDAAEGAIAFEITSWQGGGTEHTALEEIEPGRYRTEQAVPVTGSWKSLVSLLRGDQVMAAPVYLPADPEIGAPEEPALDRRDITFVRNTKLLLREQHPGPAWPSLLAYSGLAVLIGLWVGLIAFTATRVRPGSGDRPGPPSSPGPWTPPSPAPQPAPEPERTLASTGGWYAPGGPPPAT